jgi:hypothetical protein
MTMENINELYSEITKRARANGVASQEEWDGIVDEVVEQFRTDGRIHDDEPTEGMEEDLRARFEEYDADIRQEGF